MMKYEVVIGLEVHAQLKTDSKIFCGCSTGFGAPPNTNICPVCTGQPGVLPVLNEKAVNFIVKTGLALGCRINKHSVFARKQYFYPDLPKNYQISQYELPFCEGGFLEITADGVKKNIGITRIHLEEDAGKLLHAIGSRELDYSLVDFNRTGVPLMEIVSEPDMRTPEEAYQYLASLKSILEYLGVSDCDMEEGKFRCDANVSLRPDGQKEFGTKAEIKNMNSLKGVRDALQYEIERQTETLESGGKIIQETRLWNAGKGTTHSMRSKEEAHDYRYFPEPDLVPLELGEDFTDKIKKDLPELPDARARRFVSGLGLSGYDARVITSDRALADYYEKALQYVIDITKHQEIRPVIDDFKNPAKILANWITVELRGMLNTVGKSIQESPISPQNLGALVILVLNETISGKIAKTVLFKMFNTGETAEAIIKFEGLVQITDESALAKLCDEVIAENAKAAAEYRAGNERAVGSLIGAVMKKTQGKANPQTVNKILKQKLTVHI
jgi:aspartyl-tRNA(Asn)/glutamyl-tRNA(Gln) amidotransferase subunit B